MFSLGVAVDMTAVLTAKRSGITVTDRVISAVATALQRHPAVNAWFGDQGVTTFDRQNVGIAVATDAGLVVPVIHDARSLTLDGIAAARRDIVEKARSGGLGIEDVSGATFTVSNLGMAGIDRFVAIVNPPQVGILAVGATTDRFVRVGDGGVWRSTADFTLSCDHRAVDGATGAAFLGELRSILEND